MKLIIIALGHKMPAWIEQGFTEYVKRMPREFAIQLVELKPGKLQSLYFTNSERCCILSVSRDNNSQLSLIPAQKCV